jgi:uncharacterized phage protein (TIGR01671 family)
MREIKFRGKAVLGGWFYGDLIHDNCGGSYIYPIDAENIYKRNQVVSETIGQYTGLKDKNGKEIYEGDIIGCHNPNIKHLIFFNEKQGRFMAALDGDIENDYYGVCGLDDSRWNATKEVIGNIHDNPELINKEE